jgi:poly(3-hydroxybutyrate) depolymerase
MFPKWAVGIKRAMCIVALIGMGKALLAQSAATLPVLKTALHPPMQYYVSLPAGWTPNRTWPIVVTVTGGLKDFQHNAELFAAARKDLPFIIVTPVNLTNGGGDLRHASEYNYASSVWDQVDKQGWCDFDLQGLAAVIADVQKEFNGQSKYFIAGHSAGGHLTWAMVLMHPEHLLGAATTGGNFRNRCIGNISQAAERAELPVKGFIGEKDNARAPLDGQFNDAKTVAAAHGFKNVSSQIVAGEDHNPMPDRVLAYFNGLLGAKH